MRQASKKPLRCGKCGHLVGTVRIKPVVRRKLIVYALGIALAMQIIAELFIELVRWAV